MYRPGKSVLKKKNGFSLIEVLVVGVILALTMGAALHEFSQSYAVTEKNYAFTRALTSALDQMETMRSWPFETVVRNFSATTFSTSNANGRGRIDLQPAQHNGVADPGLLRARVVVCWREINSTRVVGEDTNLNGQLDAGEDTNQNGVLDSPVSLETLITKKY